MAGFALAVEPCFSENAQPRREAKAQKMHESEDVIGEAGRVGVMLLDAQIRLVVKQAIEHIGSMPDADVDRLGVVGRELTGEVGVERPSRLRAILWIDVAGALSLPSHFEALPVRGRVVPSPQCSANGWRDWALTSPASALN